jgi:hypothetical protein
VEKETSEAAAPQRDEVLALLELIHQEILNGGSSKRKLERHLELGQGYIGSLIRGRIMLKVEHLWVLGEAVGFEPLVLLFRAAPKEHQERFLKELGLRSEQDAEPPAPVEPMTREEIEELVRKVVRQEMARMATS